MSVAGNLVTEIAIRKQMGGDSRLCYQSLYCIAFQLHKLTLIARLSIEEKTKRRTKIKFAVANTGIPCLPLIVITPQI